jgi:hypothetical protein
MSLANIAHGKVTIPGVDDGEELTATDVSSKRQIFILSPYERLLFVVGLLI